MKKSLVIFMLVVASLFVASAAFSASINVVMYATENDGDPGEAGAAGPAITSDRTFQINTDGSGNIISFAEAFLDSNWTVATTGGNNLATGTNYTAGDAAYTSGYTYVLANMTDATTGHWFMGYCALLGFNVRVNILGWTWDGSDGSIGMGPNASLRENYTFHYVSTNPEIPIPAAAWLLLSGLVGLVALRRKN
jgi:hypothetical protein